MSSSSDFVFLLTFAAAALMASNRVRFDVVALLVVLALMLSGVLTVSQSLAGFGSPVVILVAGLLVVGEMLARTGVAALVGDWILEQGGSSEIKLLVLIMVGAAVLGAIMSSTAVVAIFIPIVLRIAADTGLNSSRLLLPMSYAALISGMLTLIATTPNIVVHEELKAAGLKGFSFFGFTAVGIAVLVAAIAYMLLVGRRLLPANEPLQTRRIADRSILDLWRSFNSADDLCRARLGADSRLVGQPIKAAKLQDAYGVRLILMESGTSGLRLNPGADTEGSFAANDLLVLVGPAENIEQATKDLHLLQLPSLSRSGDRLLWQVGGAAVLIHPESRFLGKTIRDIEFDSRFSLQVLGMRHGTEIVEDYADAPLASGDSLFVVGSWQQIQQLSNRNHDFVVLELPGEMADIVPVRDKLPIALSLLGLMVLLTVFDIVPLSAAVLLAALGGVFTRCLTMEDAYESIHWSSIVLIAGMLPLADALQQTGGTQLIVDSLLAATGDTGPHTLLAIFFFLTAGLGLVLSNTASAVLVAPMAIFAAQALDISPYPFAVAVVVAASAAYSTPVSTPVVTLVVDPGRYRFVDFLRLGLPLLFLTYLATAIVAPLVFPF